MGVCAESVRRWRRVWEEGGASALRRRAATGRPPKLDDAQVETVRAALEQGAQAHGFEADLWTLERVGAVVERVTGVSLSRASVWRLLTGRLGMESAAARAAGGRAGRVGDRPLDRARVAAHQKGAVNTRAWIVFLDESGVSLLPQIRRTYAPRGRTPLLRHRLNWKRASMAAALGYHSTDPDRGARPVFPPQARQLRHRRAHRGPGADEGVLPRRAGGPGLGRPVRPLEPGDAGLGRRTGLAHPGTITRLRTRAEPGGTALVVAQEARTRQPRRRPPRRCRRRHRTRHPPHQPQPATAMVLPRPHRPDHPPTTPPNLRKDQ